MKNLRLLLVISVVANTILLCFILKPDPVINDNEYKIRVEKEITAHKNRVIVDSIRHSQEIEKLNKKVYYVQKKRKDEHNKYELELSKINNLVNDSSINAYLDSLQKVCCSNSPGR